MHNALSRFHPSPRPSATAKGISIQTSQNFAPYTSPPLYLSLFCCIHLPPATGQDLLRKVTYYLSNAILMLCYYLMSISIAFAALYSSFISYTLCCSGFLPSSSALSSLLFGPRCLLFLFLKKIMQYVLLPKPVLEGSEARMSGFKARCTIPKLCDLG